MRATSPRFANRHWFRLSPLSVLLAPAALLLAALVAARRLLYRTGVFASVRLPVPVVVVGNIVAGGTGKTPLTIALARDLAARGHRPGIVSRGFGAADSAPRAVLPTDGARDAGDEPLLLARRSGAPVYIGRDRVAAARALLAAHPGCDVILLDDGLQHYRIARDIELCVQDDRGLGNRLPIPAGPLREPASRAVDVLVLNLPPGAEPGPVTAAARQSRMQIRPGAIRLVRDRSVILPPTQVAGPGLHAVAGIGNPGRFFATLRALGLAFEEHVFNDHQDYDDAQLRFPGARLVLMTEKDAVKCEGFGRNDLAYLEVDAELDPALPQWLDGRLAQLRGAVGPDTPAPS